MKSALDTAGEADAAFVSLKERLRNEATAAGMDAPPWTSTEFLPRLATTIQAHALQHILGTPYSFDWQELGPESVYIGDTVYTGKQILQGGDPADVPTLKKDFEEFFTRAESWPEAANIRTRWDERASAAEAAIELLAAAANTDPITSRCFLCQGSEHRAGS